MTDQYVILNNCLCCGGSSLKEVLNLGKQPWANDFHSNNREIPSYPLSLNLCTSCFHSQLGIALDSSLMFSSCAAPTNVSNTIAEYCNWFAKHAEEQASKLKMALVISLYPQCNDGTQLKALKTNGWIVHNLDSVKSNREAYADMTIRSLPSEESVLAFGCKEYDAIVVQNVLAHVKDMVYFLKCCKLVMGLHSRLYIQTSQADMIDNNQFDNIYHEHLSYFSTKSMLELCKRVGLVCLNIKKVPLYGGSYVFTLGVSGEEDQTVADSLFEEQNRGRYDLNRYDLYAQTVRKMIDEFATTINQYKNTGHLIIGYGAAAKGNTFLNASGVSMDMIVDENPMKIGMYTPGSNIVIVGQSEVIGLTAPVLVVPLAWTFYEEIKKKLMKIVSASANNFKMYCYYPSKKVEVLTSNNP